jgi:hypothetical protein
MNVSTDQVCNFLNCGIPFMEKSSSKIYELETRIYIGNLNLRQVTTLMENVRTEQCNVQRFEGVDIYDSCYYRVKHSIKKFTVSYCNQPLTFHLSRESQVKKISDDIQSEDLHKIKICFNEIDPIKRCVFKISRNVELKIFYKEDSIIDGVLELDYDPSNETDKAHIFTQFNIFINFLKKITAECLHSSISAKFNRTKQLEKMKVLKHPNEILDNFPIYTSPKWNGERRFFKISKNYVNFNGKGYSPNIFEFRENEIQTLKNNYPMMYLFMNEVGFIVEYINEKQIIVFDIAVNENIQQRIKIIQNLNISILAEILRINLNVQSFHKIFNPQNMLRIPFNNYCDGVLVVTNNNKLFKLKFLHDQTLDLLYNNEGKYVTSEGIEIPLIIKKENEKPEPGKVYELKITDWKCKYGVFRRVNKVSKIELLRNCDYEQVKYRSDKGPNPNALDTIINYLECDIMFFSSELIKVSII